MVKRSTIIKEIKNIFGQEFLEKAQEKDKVANGVQFHGQQEVKKVALGVSLNEDFLKAAVKADAQFCIFHHGFDPRTYKSLYSKSSQKRLEMLIKENLTIAGYHYALDAHREIGNNATLIRELGAEIKRPLYDEWGFTAEFDKPQETTKLADKLSELVEHDVLAIYTGPEKVKKIGVVTGAAKPHAENIAEMSEKGVELFISGETSESRPHVMQEEGINYFLCGHYATEVFGVQELGKKLKNKFKDRLEIEFIEIPNPV